MKNTILESTTWEGIDKELIHEMCCAGAVGSGGLSDFAPEHVTGIISLGFNDSSEEPEADASKPDGKAVKPGTNN